MAVLQFSISSHENETQIASIMRTSFVLGPIRNNFWNLQFSDSRASAMDHLFAKIYVLNNQPWFSS